ncbi:cardiolipin synthase [Pasteurellaceae bacterium HPA106]|uniref:cardiolipin synthase n=1 Tax=Spirabiliibacterium pneumoniae TaxID=221400 RepID=UPI001AAC989A|nr:cardiolipin synthase [Spirabiliibacterium pneumoniae]MBE2895688.1 cardiolipin synthase [Spirabiliibacterium pneumoniae]
MLFLTLFHLSLVVIFTFRILLRDDLEPSARLAWFVVLMVLPYFGTALYILFGENNIGRKVSEEYHVIFTQMRQHYSHIIGDEQHDDSKIAIPYRPAFAYATSINGFYTLDGNRAELMPDAQTARTCLENDILNAKHSVDILYYIWLDDGTGKRVANAVISAAKRGVKCRVMVDGLGSRQFIRASYWQEMKHAGVQLAVAFPINHPLKTIITSRLDLRNHRKITLVDGKILYCGSQNCADPEFRIKAKYAPWVDILLRFEGAVVEQMQLLFESDWLTANRQPLPHTAHTVKKISTTSEYTTGFPAQVIGDGPTERHNSSPQLFSALFNCARQTIVLSTPYFVPDTMTIESICAAALRGVEVTLIFPQRNDSWVVSAASRSHYKRLLHAGVNIFEFQGGLLHAKTLTIDNKVSLIGSTNLDMRSFNLNYENNILLQDAATTNAIFERQQSYIQSAVQVTLDDVKQWRFYRRIWQNVIATVSPVL